MPVRNLSIRPYSSAIGAEVLGVNLARPLDEGIWTHIHEAFRQHLVLFFRDQDLSPASSTWHSLAASASSNLTPTRTG